MLAVNCSSSTYTYAAPSLEVTTRTTAHTHAHVTRHDTTRAGRAYLGTVLDAGQEGVGREVVDGGDGLLERVLGPQDLLVLGQAPHHRGPGTNQSVHAAQHAPPHNTQCHTRSTKRRSGYFSEEATR